MATKTAILSALGVAAGGLALAACSSDSLTSVDLRAENHPPLTATVAGNGVQLPAGIGIAFVATLSVNGKTTEDNANITTTDPNCNVTSGINKNEFFMTCNEPGKSGLLVEDDSHSDLNSLTLPVTVTAQAGSVPFPDGGFPPPPGFDAGPIPDGSMPVDSSMPPDSSPSGDSGGSDAQAGG
jgi:hypothetical protein